MRSRQRTLVGPILEQNRKRGGGTAFPLVWLLQTLALASQVDSKSRPLASVLASLCDLCVWLFCGLGTGRAGRMDIPFTGQRST